MDKLWLFSVALLAASSSFAYAAELHKDVGTIKVAEEAYGDEEDRFDQSHNMSGLLCPAADWCLLVSDELRGVHRLKVERNADNLPNVRYDAAIDLGEPSEAFQASHGLTGLDELDLEAIASDGNMAYFIGSHANKRKSGKYNAGSHLVAIAGLSDLRSNSAVPAKWVSLDGLFKRNDMFPNALGKELQCGGINVEGATIAGADLLIGLRSPTRLEGGGAPAAYFISVPLGDLLSEKFDDAKLHVVPTTEPFIGIRAMETVGDAVLVVTGDAGVNDLPKKKPSDPPRTCDSNLNKEHPDRPFQLRLLKSKESDAFATEPLMTFEPVKEKDFKKKPIVAKLEAIAADPARPDGLFVIYDGSDTVQYLTGVTLQ